MVAAMENGKILPVFYSVDNIFHYSNGLAVAMDDYHIGMIR